MKRVMERPNPDTGDRPGPADWLTVPGRLLLIFTLVAGAGAFYFYFMGSYDVLPPGSYPVLLWLLPVALAGVAFFWVAALVLERLGVPIYRNRTGRT
jgi:hypothetical protein